MIYLLGVKELDYFESCNIGTHPRASSVYNLHARCPFNTLLMNSNRALLAKWHLPFKSDLVLDCTSWRLKVLDVQVYTAALPVLREISCNNNIRNLTDGLSMHTQRCLYH